MRHALVGRLVYNKALDGRSRAWSQKGKSIACDAQTRPIRCSRAGRRRKPTGT
ncbi:MAG: hypothetical protein OXF25_11190 [Cyanobacteria bacterium MAG CAR3_bin_5]|nr:hypothetical protein [Cyanobacteria bacterium MAG CAR3_bin_5]